MHESTDTKHAHSEWKKLFLLAFVGLPIAMVGVIVAYGFIVWGLQVFFFGPPGP